MLEAGSKWTKPGGVWYSGKKKDPGDEVKTVFILLCCAGCFFFPSYFLMERKRQFNWCLICSKWIPSSSLIRGKFYRETNHQTLYLLAVKRFWYKLDRSQTFRSPGLARSKCNRSKTVLIDSPKIMDSRAVTLTKISPKHFGKFCNKRMQTKQD